MNRFTSAARVRLLLFLSLPLAFGACREARTANYRIPKEHPAGPAPAATAAASSAPAPAVTVAARPVGDLTWTAPTPWKAKPTSSMRRGSFDVGEGTGPLADLAITVFPGDVGGDLANVNRWRGQLNLPPIAEADLASALQPVTGGKMAIRVADLSGGTADNPQRMLSAIVPHGGSTWFFKLTGPAAIVGTEKARFLEFLATVAPAPASVEAPAATSAPAPMMGAVTPPPGAIAAAAAIPNLRWEAPAHWQAKPASALRKGTYILTDAAGGSAELAITAFPGAVGGELANVNRWRGQLQLPPVEAGALAASITRFTAHGLPVAVVEFTGGPEGSQRLLGAMVPCNGATWFFKLTGPDALVAAEKPAFLSFLQSLSAP